MHTSIEPLESRIAPASITITGKTATWTDHDGDLVTMKWTSTDAPTFTTMDKGDGLLVSRIVLDAAKHTGAAFTVAVKAAGVFGDGRVELGHLDGPGVAPKSWIGAKAGISEIDLGGDTTTIGSLVVGSVGQTKVAEFTGSMGDNSSSARGSFGTVKINGDVGIGVLHFTSGAATGTIGSFSITGSLRDDITSTVPNTGLLVFDKKNVGSLSIGGHITKGARLEMIFGDPMKSVTVKGSVEGFIGIEAVKLTIGGSIHTGVVLVSGAKSVTVGGSIVAQDVGTSSDTNSGGLLTVYAEGTASIVVKGSLLGVDAPTWKGNGFFNSGKHVGAIRLASGGARIVVGGDIVSGAIADLSVAVNGGIVAEGGNIASVTVGGSLLGNDLTPVHILALGSAPASGDFNAIGSITVKGSAIHAYIAAGTRIDGSTSNVPQTYVTTGHDAGIGAVKIGGNFVTSNIFAGVDDGGSIGVNNTAAGDTLGVGDPARTAKLGPVVIKGHLLSDREAFSFGGFAADTIASITVNGRKVFTAGDGLRNFDTYLTAREL